MLVKRLFEKPGFHLEKHDGAGFELINKRDLRAVERAA